MNTPNRRLLLWTVLLLGSLAVSTSGAKQSTTDMDKMEEMIVTASSTKDHEALAAEYASEAQSSRDFSALHKKMAQSYDNLAGGSSKGGYGAFAGHCRKLASRYAKTAEDYARLATLHQEFAAELAAKTAPDAN